jgi:hypothetical protein
MNFEFENRAVAQRRTVTCHVSCTFDVHTVFSIWQTAETTFPEGDDDALVFSLFVVPEEVAEFKNVRITFAELSR